MVGYVWLCNFSKYLVSIAKCDRCAQELIWNKIGWYDPVDYLSGHQHVPYNLIVLCCSCQKILENEGHNFIKKVGDHVREISSANPLFV